MQLLPVNDNNNRPSEGENYPITPADSFDSLDDIEGKGKYSALFGNQNNTNRWTQVNYIFYHHFK